MNHEPPTPASGCHVQVLASPHIGGAERIAFDLHRHLVSDRGIDSALFIPMGGAALTHAREIHCDSIGFRLERVLSRNMLRSGAENLSILSRIPRGTHHLHFHSPIVFGAFALARRLAKVPTVLHLHLNYTSQELEWALEVTPDAIFTCGQSVIPAIETVLDAQRLGRRPRIRAIPNPVDTERFYPSANRQASKTSLGFDPNVPLILVVANLAQHKGQDTAIRAVSVLRDRRVPVRLALVGEERGTSGFLRHLQGLVNQLALSDSVDFLGFRRDIPELMRAADFMLLPSVSEAMPLSILEAQASKTLVIAAPTADIPELITDGRTGYLVPARDEAGYADRISLCLRDPGIAASITNAAHGQVLERHQPLAYWGMIVDEYKALRSNRAGSY